MAILNYKKQFAHLVERGEKPQTIRAKRKYPLKVGERLYHYTGLRTKQARKLLENNCTGAFDLHITEDGEVYIGGACLFESMKHGFALADGFRGLYAWGDMLTFFKTTHGLPFDGQLIVWDQKYSNAIRDYIERNK